MTRRHNFPVIATFNVTGQDESWTVEVIQFDGFTVTEKGEAIFTTETAAEAMAFAMETAGWAHAVKPFI